MTDHNDHHDHRSAEEIEKDIHRSRERLDSTLHEIEERFSPQQLLNTSYDYLRHGGANEFVSNLGNTIKQNPLPFLVTTAGLGWLMLAQRNPGSQQSYPRSNQYGGSQGTPGIPVHEGTHAQGGAQGSAPGYASSPGYVPGSNETHGSHQTHGSQQGRMSSMKEGAKDKAQQFGDKAKDVAHQLSDKAHNLGDKAHHMGDSMRDSTSHLQHGTQDHLHNMSDRARQMGSSSSDFIQEHPLVVGALGVALGAALAGLFPTTRKEDEYMGEYRDRALHKAAEVGQEQADKAQHAVHDKAEEMKDGTREHDKKDDKQNPAERHDSGLANSNTPSGNTQGKDTLEPPKR